MANFAGRSRRPNDTFCRAREGRARCRWLHEPAAGAPFALALTMWRIGRDTKPEALINPHFSIGVAILLIAVVQLARALERHHQ